MKKREKICVIAIIGVLPNIALAIEQDMENTVHKFWICAIDHYSSLEEGKYQERTCRANTQYSEPPCPEFFVEYEGVNGIRPGVPFEKRVDLDSIPAHDNKTHFKNQSTTIEIKKDKKEHVYLHTIVKTDGKSTNRWVYQGKCQYYQAPNSEKIYINNGLKTEL